MPRALCYADAVKLLGGDSPLVRTLDRLTGGLLLMATGGGSELALSLFDARGELARLSAELVSRLSDRLRGLSRFDRTERLAAAHRIILLTAYFEALSGAALPFEPEELRLARTSQITLVTGETASSGRLRDLVGILSDTDVPGEYVPFSGDGLPDELRQFYASVSDRLLAYVEDLDAWSQVSQSARAEFVHRLGDEVPTAAQRRYEEHVRRLAAEFPEVAFWANRLDHSTTRDRIQQLHTCLQGLEQVLERIGSGSAPDGRREALARRYRKSLNRPIVATGDVPEGLTIPSLEAAHVNPLFRVAAAGLSANLDRESWWDEFPVRDDVQEFLIGYLTSIQAVEGPLLVLGQPGSGKSVLTKALAARLPPRDYLTVRVALREVPADTDLQSQIEYAIRDATGESLTWPALARSAGDALPVILLDGFDELLQATGIGQSDYLEQVARFQEREADQGRPVAVIVTSRTAVADRARLPRSGAVALKLEAFSDDQVERWLTVWNAHNNPYLVARGLLPLSATAVLRQRDLASQPLLLLMLALYDVDSNALQRHGEGLDEAGLYDRILASFAEREVRKARPELHAEPLRAAVEEELLVLSVAAFAMFNRGQQWVAEDELSGDLAAILSGTVAPRNITGFHAVSTLAQTVVGRFFFIHEARAVRDNAQLTSCEFLHATFGEYLVARLIVRELDDLALVASARRRHTADDGFLRALLSFAPLTMRGKIVDFLTVLVQRLPEDRRPLLREVLLTAFGGALLPWKGASHDGYGPEQISVPARHAAYSANLLLLVVVTGLPEPVTGRELFPQVAFQAAFPVPEWRRHAMLWRSQFTVEGWRSLTVRLHLERIWHNGDRDVSVSLASGPWSPADFDTYWFSNMTTTPEGRRWSGWRQVGVGPLRRESYFTCDMAEDVAWHGLAPLIRTLDAEDADDPEGGLATTAFGSSSEEVVVSATHALIALWIASSGPANADELQQRYEECLQVIRHSRSDDDSAGMNALLARVVRQLAADRDRLPAVFLERLRDELFGLALLTETYLSEHPMVRHWAAEAFSHVGFPAPTAPAPGLE